jgi:hypothetical protein
VDASDKDSREGVNVVTCTACGCQSGLRWEGWRAYRVDEPERGGPPTLVFYCLACAQKLAPR